MGVDTLLLEVGPKVVKADMVLFGELAQIGPTWSEPGMFGPLFPLFKPEFIRLEVSMTIGVVRGV